MRKAPLEKDMRLEIVVIVAGINQGNRTLGGEPVLGGRGSCRAAILA
jgi:hypothetical protein